MSLAVKANEACYIPLGHGAGDLLAADTPDQIGMDEAIALLKPLLEDPAVLKVGQNFKYDMTMFHRHGIDVSPVDDTMLISFAQSAGRHGHGMDELSERYFDHKPIPFKEVAGTGKKQITFDQVPIPEATKYAGEDADVTLRLWELLKPRLSVERVSTLYETIERPLIPVIAQMERAGIKVDREHLSRLSAETCFFW